MPSDEDEDDAITVPCIETDPPPPMPTVSFDEVAADLQLASDLREVMGVVPSWAQRVIARAIERVTPK